MTRAVHREVLSESVKFKLVEGLAKQNGVLIIGGGMQMIVGTICWHRTGLPWYLGWTVAALIVTACRYALNITFTRSGLRARQFPHVWRLCSFVGACAAALPLGIASAFTVRVPDAFLQVLVASVLTSLVMGFAARNAVDPTAVYAFVLLSELPISVSCLTSHDGFYMVFGVIIFFFIFAAFSLARYQYDQAVRFMVADERNEALVNAVNMSNHELAEANRQLEAMAVTDGLTGLANRRSFDAELAKVVLAARRDGTDLSVLMLDIDSFKGYNDRYGHQMGDRCLRSVAAALKSALRRPGDTMARYGGEEFVGILPHTDAHGALVIAQEMRLAIEALGIEHAASGAGVVTVSIGVATLSVGADGDGDELVRRADAALYTAKHEGRNRVRIAPNPHAQSALSYDAAFAAGDGPA